MNISEKYTTSQASKILEKIGRDWFIDVSEVDRFQRERRKVGRPGK